jgi:uncharacterized protein involved in exopolysaccharide biosynthesis
MLDHVSENTTELSSGVHRDDGGAAMQHLRDFLVRYAKLLAACVLGALSIAVLYLLVATPVYTATTRLLLDSGSNPVFTRALNESLITLDTPQIESQLVLLISEQIAKRVAAALTPAEASEVTSVTRAGKDAAVVMNELATVLQGQLDVKRVTLSHAIDISYSAHNPAIAAKIANMFGEAYVADQVENFVNDARRRSQWLLARIEELRRQMNTASTELQAFRARRDYRVQQRQDADDKEAMPVTLEELESRSQTYRKIYESYLQSYTEMVQRESFRSTSSRVISWASAPKRTSRPNKLLVLSSALVLGSLVGLGTALVYSSFAGSAATAGTKT